jgi:hypothetical protein
MSTSILNDRIKKKIERYAEYTGRPVNEVLDELVPEVPASKRRSVKGLLEGKLDHLLEDADFEGLHQDMLKRYGSDTE